MTLDTVIAFILRYFTEFDSFTGPLNYVTVVEDGPKGLMPSKYRLHIWPKLTDACSGTVSLRQLSFSSSLSFRRPSHQGCR